MTWTPTFTQTTTANFTETATKTPAFSATGTPVVDGILAIYPNPVSGGSVYILPPIFGGVSDVRIRIFTVSYRKVLDTIIPKVPSGRVVQVRLTDSWGRPLADGLYYVVVTTARGRYTAKLVVLK
jgi:hypothetical protein